MKKLDRLVRPAINNDEIVQHSRAQKVLARWPEIVGEGLAKRSWPDRFTRGTVWVAVTGSAWAQELRLMKETIVVRLNEIAGENLFSNVRFGVRPLPIELDAATTEVLVEEDKPLARDTDLSIQEIVRRRLEKRKSESDG